MKITLDVLEQKGAYYWFLIYFKTLKKQEWDVYKLVKQIHKDKYSYSEWLFREFKLSGVCKLFYSNGSIWGRINYKDGKMNGSYEKFHENGSIKQKIDFKDGKWDGPYEAFDEDGKLIHSFIYKDDIKVKVLVQDGMKVE